MSSLYLVSRRLEEVFAAELQSRLPERVFRQGRRDSSDTGPMCVVKCDRAREISPDCGVYKAEMAIVIVRPIDDPAPAGTTKTADQSAFVKDVEKALNQIPRPGFDADIGIDLKGWVQDEIAEASTEQDHGDIIFMTVGCMLMEKRGEPEVQTPVES